MKQKKIFLLGLSLMLSHTAFAQQAVTATPPAAVAPVVQPQPQPPLQPGISLNAALAEAYSKNPSLQAARAALKSADQIRPQATAGFKPSLTGIADYTSSHSAYDNDLNASGDAKTLQLGMTQSIYSGGSTLADVSAAENEIRATQAELQTAEQDVLLDAVIAYMNLIRDQEIVQLNLNNEKVLDQHLRASQERFKLGDITKTDVSQSESRLAKATASRIAAEGAVKKSRAFFERVIGLAPLDLQKPDILAIILPASENEALQIAEKNNPSIAFARYTQAAAKDRTRSIEGTNMPQVDLNAAVGKVYDPVATITTANNATTQSVGLRATLPLYTGGSTAARIQQSKENENQLRMETRSSERAVREAVIAAWETLASANAESQARLTQITASKLALDGVKVESDFGSRTTLDLLDAEQEYLDAQVAQVTADTDKTIAAYGVLAAVGSLTAENLKLDVAIYDPHSLQNTQ